LVELEDDDGRAFHEHRLVVPEHVDGRRHDEVEDLEKCNICLGR
jgi:hypothetical protein